jgi:GTP pyrophosphokinase
MEIAPHAPPEIAVALAATRELLLELGASSTEVDSAMEAAETVGELTLDPKIAEATALHWTLRGKPLPEPVAASRRVAAQVIALTAQLGRLGELRLPVGWSAAQGLNRQQAETLRNMLLATAADPRLVVARLAEQLVRLRHARALGADERRRLALETRAIFAPLANRLGVWSLKWELEDQAFRYLEPQEYRRIADALAERRSDRERYIEQVCALLERELAQAGIAAKVYGRPKHIYSIWRKMQRKHVAFEQLFDVRAVRIVVDSVADCYAALGIVHGLWHYVAGEFDDYIATPKGNEYRSIHTAVIGPEHKSLEIQIRSRDMHEQAELGIAAHWRYKEGGSRDQNYERKIEWVRRVLDPTADAADADFVERVKVELFADRIYAMTPHGEIVDLPRGATPLDFAYHVHTELGHRCRGAKVNGRIVPLNQPLKNGEIVEIITAKNAAPSRDWLAPDQHYLASPRSRAKVRAWFRRLDEAGGRGTGEDLEREDAQATADGAAPGVSPASELPQLALTTRRRTGSGRTAVDIEGVGDLPTTMARCCGPVPPEPIAGYLTLGRGVTIHRADCPNLKRMRGIHPERVLNVEWNLDTDGRMPVQIRVEAFDRRGLLRDVSDVMALEKLSIEGVNSNTDPDDRIATIVMRTAVRDLEQLGRVLARLRAVPNVLKTRRVD